MLIISLVGLMGCVAGMMPWECDHTQFAGVVDAFDFEYVSISIMVHG